MLPWGSKNCREGGTIVFSISSPVVWVIWACYSFLRWPALPTVPAFSRINNMLKWANLVEIHAGNIKLGSRDGVWYTEYNDTAFMTIWQILMGWTEFSDLHGNIWQTLYHYHYGHVKYMVMAVVMFIFEVMFMDCSSDHWNMDDCGTDY